MYIELESFERRSLAVFINGVKYKIFLRIITNLMTNAC